MRVGRSERKKALVSRLLNRLKLLPSYNYMYVIACAPIRVFNVDQKPSKKRHWRQRSASPREITDDRIEQLDGSISEYKRTNDKMKMLVTLNIQATLSTLKQSQDILQILEDLSNN
jgi:hypothetical protein